MLRCDITLQKNRDKLQLPVVTTQTRECVNIIITERQTNNSLSPNGPNRMFGLQNECRIRRGKSSRHKQVQQ